MKKRILFLLFLFLPFLALADRLQLQAAINGYAIILRVAEKTGGFTIIRGESAHHYKVTRMWNEDVICFKHDNWADDVDECESVMRMAARLAIDPSVTTLSADKTLENKKK